MKVSPQLLAISCQSSIISKKVNQRTMLYITSVSELFLNRRDQITKKRNFSHVFMNYGTMFRKCESTNLTQPISVVDSSFTLRKRCPYSKLLWSVFPRIRLEYGASLGIHSECREIRTRITPNTDTFHVVFLMLTVTSLTSCH